MRKITLEENLSSLEGIIPKSNYGKNKAKSIPLFHRMTEPEDVASTVAFLASSDSSHITSETIMVTGGMKTL